MTIVAGASINYQSRKQPIFPQEQSLEFVDVWMNPNQITKTKYLNLLTLLSFMLYAFTQHFSSHHSSHDKENFIFTFPEDFTFQLSTFFTLVPFSLFRRGICVSTHNQSGGNNHDGKVFILFTASSISPLPSFFSHFLWNFLTLWRVVIVSCDEEFELKFLSSAKHSETE